MKGVYSPSSDAFTDDCISAAAISELQFLKCEDPSKSRALRWILLQYATDLVTKGFGLLGVSVLASWQFSERKYEHAALEEADLKYLTLDIGHAKLQPTTFQEPDFDSMFDFGR